MNKKIKGYEVMKLIAENKIKEGQGFLFTSAAGDVEEKICWHGDNFRCIDSERNYLLGSIGDIDFATGDFEILEDEEEIDIQGIEEIKGIVAIDERGYITRETFEDFVNKINDLVKATKKLDKNKVDYIQPYKED